MRVLDLAIIGAGPVGLEAAALAATSGLETQVLEAGVVAEHVRRWGSVRLFSPFELNTGPASSALLSAAGTATPRRAEIMTGAEFRERYLLRLATALGPAIEIRERTRVLDVARAGWLKGEALGSPTRADHPFRLLTVADGIEQEVFAHSVFDCSGVYGRPNWAGPGGTPARGERALREAIDYHVPDPLGADRDRFASARTLLLGGGHSAATTALALSDLAGEVEGTRFSWATRRAAGAPLETIVDDPLPERAALIGRANAMAASPPPGSEWLPATRLMAVHRTAGTFQVEIDVAGKLRVDRFDRIAANIGYEPDDSLYRQLQVHECYASRGPMKLAAVLLAASADGPVDCLDQGGFGPETLENPEPDFFILGAKSFGKNSVFLMRTGYEQVADAFSLINPEPATAK